jgi:CheY-like chemotaxis protein
MSKEKPNILVVDDVGDWRITMRGMLQDEGYQVQVADTSPKALAILEEQPFDLAVIDIRLDETNEDDTEGITLAKKIHKRWPHIRIIIITGYDTPGTLEEAMKPTPEGRLVHDYILKKDTDTHLIPTIRRALSES